MRKESATIMDAVLASGMTGVFNSAGDNQGGNDLEKVPDPQVTELAKKVDETTVNESVVKVGHEALRELLNGCWSMRTKASSDEALAPLSSFVLESSSSPSNSTDFLLPNFLFILLTNTSFW